MLAWFEELSEFLTIPSISAERAHAPDVARAGEWVCELIRGAGGKSELIDWHGHPLAIGEIRATVDPEQAPTVLCYGHFDVQPPDPLELWDSPPFAPEIRGDYIYGRGVADDKGQLYMLLCAARELAQAGALPVNVRFACDGEEETDGESIVEYLEADERGADAAVIFDSGMIRKGLAAFHIGTRGLLSFHVALTTGRRDLHSGVYGGAALNAAHALIQALGAVIAAAGALEAVSALRSTARAKGEAMSSTRGPSVAPSVRPEDQPSVRAAYEQPPAARRIHAACVRPDVSSHDQSGPATRQPQGNAGACSGARWSQSSAPSSRGLREVEIRRRDRI